MKIVIDMMGSDAGSIVTVPAVRNFKNSHPEVELFVVGKKEEIESLSDIATIVDAQDVIQMEAGPMEFMRGKTTSMHVALNVYIKEAADAIISAGSTGAILSGATLKLKLIPGVERAAILSPFPTIKKDNYVVILDIGANNENNAKQLGQFALMGRLYAKNVYGKENPKTYLLSNGTEETKGSPLVKETHKLLIETKFPNFMGNIEGKQVLEGEADVVVCDGYTGNVLLKSVEGTAKMMTTLLKEAFKSNFSSKIGYLLSKGGIDEMRERLDYKNTGGALLAGINGVVIKAHGSSDVKGFTSALEVAFKMADKNVVELLRQGFNTNE
ncbi:MAG TPA: phosphate acyltransferase PlsX [Bacilli bacterium]|nr:phosphate acyltransferase PlsX [Bacilli bacterium]